MDFTENEVYEALGVKPETPPPGADGGSGDPPKGPAARERPASSAGEDGNGQAPAGLMAGRTAEAGGAGGPEEPAGEPEEQSRQRKPENAEAGGAENPEGPAGEPGEQSPEERRKNAAARRRAEQQAAVDEAVERAVRQERDRAKEEMAAFFKRARLKNTITGEDIHSMEEFDDWEKAFSDARLQRELKEGKLTPEGLERAISENPAVRRAQELVRRQEEEARAAEAAAAKARVDAELLEIRKLDPSVQSVEDLLHMDTAKEFYALVQRGNTFLDAFRLANYERLTARAAEAARQQAQNLSRSKEHLKATALQRGGGAISVPPDELELFREMNPGASEAEIQAYYNKYKDR